MRRFFSMPLLQQCNLHQSMRQFYSVSTQSVPPPIDEGGKKEYRGMGRHKESNRVTVLPSLPLAITATETLLAHFFSFFFVSLQTSLRVFCALVICVVEWSNVRNGSHARNGNLGQVQKDGPKWEGSAWEAGCWKQDK